MYEFTMTFLFCLLTKKIQNLILIRSSRKKIKKENKFLSQAQTKGNPFGFNNDDLMDQRICSFMGCGPNDTGYT
jgi:hypothetical protein